MMTDPIADFLTRIRNSLMMKREQVEAISSNMIRRLAEILREQGYVGEIDENTDSKRLVIRLKYDQSGNSVIEGVKRISKPGLRVYVGAKELPKVRGGMGMAIVSTSKGVMTGDSARVQGLGGEVVCHVW